MLFKTLKTQSSRQVLTIIAICTLGVPGALAQTASVPQFNPTGSWSAQPTQLASVRGLHDVKLPCVLSNEYDNGYIVRFSGGGKQLLAMAIDFRQNVFQQGRQYDAMLSVGGGYVKQVKATAFTANTLIFNLRPLSDIYAVMKSANEMELSIANNNFKFNLAQIGAAYAPLESCYAGEVRTAQAAPAVIPPAVSAAPRPATFDDIVNAAPNDANVAPNAAGKPMNISQVTPRGPDAVLPRENRVSKSTEGSSQWEARVGEDIKTVLGRWSQKAGYDLQWDAAQSGSVVQDVSLNGSFEQAVQQLLAENAAANGLSGKFDSAGSSVASAPRSQWNAPAGANIQTVLNQWAQSAGVRIVWQSYASIPVKNAVAMDGSFESAVQSLLDQYQSSAERPVGQLNTDPTTGQRTLLMDVDRS